MNENQTFFTAEQQTCFIELRGAAGGDEAKIWASGLMRMYMRFAVKKNWKPTLLDELTLKITGIGAFDVLKYESGVHRVQRTPATEKRGRIHTSTATVVVLPQVKDNDISVDFKDLDWQFYRSGGHGGQNVNKVSTAVRLTHKPSGIVVTAQTERFQERNRMYALNLLRAKLWALETKRREENIADIKGEYRPASWGNQIRSYVLHPYKMVKDLRTDYEVGNEESVLDGDLDGFIEEELKIGNKN